MEKNITRVSWTARNIPEGLNFNTNTGTFTGEIDAEGEYVVPVKVETNYGSDEKDVKIVAEGKSYPVYAIGRYSATWSQNATANDSGFRKLPMPNAKKLVTLYSSFGAKISSGKWYACGNTARYFGITTSGFTTNQPVELPIENVAEIAGGYSARSDVSNSPTAYFMYRTFGNLMRWVTTRLSNNTYTSSTIREGISKLNGSLGDGIIYQNIDGEIAIHDVATLNVAFYTPDKPVKTLLKQGLGGITYLTQEGELWRIVVTSQGFEVEQLGSELGPIREVWLFPGANTSPSSDFPRSIFAQCGSDGKLYAMGGNTTYQLGLPEAKYYNEFTEVGSYNVKKIDRNFMLTTDGKLYHTGNAITNITGKHTGGYAQIFPELKFKDISYNSASQTLVVLIDDGSTETNPEPTEYKYNYIYLHNDDPDTREIDLHEYLSAWGANAGICLSDTEINSVSYFWSNAIGNIGEELSIPIQASARYDISTGKIVINKNGNFIDSGGVVDSKNLTITTNKGVITFVFTIYVCPQVELDETILTGQTLSVF